MNPNTSFSQRIQTAGLNKDMRDYQKLKEAHEMEVEGTRRLYESLKRKGGEEYAIKELKKRGYNPGLIGK